METNHSQDKSATIAASYSRLMARQLGLQEKDLALLLRGTGISARELMDDRTLFTKDQQLQVMSNAIKLSGDEGFGLRLGQLLTPPTHGPLGFLANSSPNLMTAIRDFQAFIPARVSLFRCRTAFEDNNLACYVDVEIEGNPGLYRCVTECFMLALIALIEFVIGKTFTDGFIHLDYPKPRYHKEYKKFIHCPIRFNRQSSKLVVPETLLFTANVSSDHKDYEFALNQCQKMLAQLDSTVNPTTHRVKTLLLSHPPGKLDEEHAARLSFISKRTLARRLEAENSSFRALRDEILMSLATDYLRDTNLSVEAIAGLLNYHDSSSFRRAFKRWQGLTPREFREQLRSSGVPAS